MERRAPILKSSDLKPNGEPVSAGKMNKLLRTYSELVSRAQLMSRLGYQYDDDRDLYLALGYKLNPDYEDYATRYERQDIAKAVINRPVEATWGGEAFTILEADDEEETELERQWAELADRLAMVSKFARLDRLTGIGRYGVLLLGLDDVKTRDDFAKPVTPSTRKLLYVKPLGEGSADVIEWDESTVSERYGLPTYYSLTIANPSGDVSFTLRVHFGRVIHVVENLLESETEGAPRLKAVLNRLYDLEKLVGGSAEMFWRGARPGYQGKVDPTYQMTPDTIEGLQAQIDEYEHNLRRILVNEGVDLQALAMQIADPAPHVDVQIQMIASETGIPKRILTGSERGELASTEDRTSWLGMIHARRMNFAEPCMVRAFVDRCIDYGVLPEPKTTYAVQWSDLWAASEQQKAEVGKTRALALQAYAAVPTAASIVPPDAFYRLFLGLSEDEVELIAEMQEASLREEETERQQPGGELPEQGEELAAFRRRGDEIAADLRRLRSAQVSAVPAADAAPIVTVPLTINVPSSNKKMRRRVNRDAKGLIAEIVEEEID